MTETSSLPHTTPGDGTDGRSGWCGRGAHHRCIGAYDVVCGCSCGHPAAGPAWATATDVRVDVRDTLLHHTWAAPTADGSSTAMAELCQHTWIERDQDGVELGRGEEPPYVALPGLDSQVVDIEEARQLAQAILACCDRLAGAA